MTTFALQRSGGSLSKLQEKKEQSEDEKAQRPLALYPEQMYKHTTHGWLSGALHMEESCLSASSRFAPCDE